MEVPEKPLQDKQPIREFHPNTDRQYGIDFNRQLYLSGTATKGTDYNNLTGTVSFAVGAATALININPIDDTLAEGSETVILTLGTGTGYTLGATKTGTVTLMDDEPYNLTFSTETIDEGQAVTFTLETRGLLERKFLTRFLELINLI